MPRPPRIRVERAAPVRATTATWQEGARDGGIVAHAAVADEIVAAIGAELGELPQAQVETSSY